MKMTLFLLLMGCGFTKVLAQNTAVINQQGSLSGTGHDVSVVQEGSGNTSVVNQSKAGTPGSRAVINQSGAGNVATVNQGNGLPDSVTSSGQSVNVTQSGAGETFINQTDGSNTISVRQSGPATPAPSGKKRKGRTNGKQSN